MQTRVYLMLGTVSAVLAVGASLWFTATSPDTPSVPSTATVAGGQTTAMPPSSAAEPADTAPVAGLPDPAAVRAYEARQVFHDQYRQFMATADQLLASQRDEQAQALALAIDEREAQGELALSEALLLQLGLIKATNPDETAQKAAAEALVARYQARSAAREAQRPAQADQRFVAYKEREKAIVSEVLALQSIPGGLSRDEYLRQRLQEAREQSYQ